MMKFTEMRGLFQDLPFWAHSALVYKQKGKQTSTLNSDIITRGILLVRSTSTVNVFEHQNEPTAKGKS